MNRTSARTKDMRGELKESGDYELILTNKDHLILVLNRKRWYAVVEGAQGDLLIHSDDDHSVKKVVQKGTFYFADFNNDPEFRDIPHLFLQEGNQFREWILPNGTPSKGDHQRKLIRTDNLVNQSTVREHVKGQGDSGTEKKYTGKAENLRTKTKQELYHLAQKRNIHGRSKLSKEELVQTLSD